MPISLAIQPYGFNCKYEFQKGRIFQVKILGVACSSVRGTASWGQWEWKLPATHSSNVSPKEIFMDSHSHAMQTRLWVTYA